MFVWRTRGVRRGNRTDDVTCAPDRVANNKAFQIVNIAHLNNISAASTGASVFTWSKSSRQVRLKGLYVVVYCEKCGWIPILALCTHITLYLVIISGASWSPALSCRCVCVMSSTDLCPQQQVRWPVPQRDHHRCVGLERRAVLSCQTKVSNLQNTFTS